MKITLVLSLSFLLLSCASYFKRKTCESTNWYDYGYKVAMQGKRLTGDSFVDECKAVEANMDYSSLDSGFKAGMANYCTPEAALNIGEAGDNYNFNFCDSNVMSKLKTQFQLGRDRLCNSKGYEFGASGKEYAGQCVSNNEPEFLKSYKKGRYNFLQNEIRLAQEEERQLNSQIWNLKNDILNLKSQKISLGSGRKLVEERTYNQTTGEFRREVREEEDDSINWERDRLDNQIRTKTSEINSKERRKVELQNKVREYRREMTKIERY
ncbi:MAG: DUF2799 domain-containing protein [Bdellovibrionota bacterium]|nr:DUF2799 domain-containing protein [Bdellovibrionota bacterium]